MEEKGGESGLSVDEASRVIKQHASQQRLTIELTEEQLSALQEQWKRGDPGKPAEIIFHVGKREIGELRVATCAYIGDTCCA